MTNYEKIMAGLTISVLAEQMEKYITCEKCEAREFCREDKTNVSCNRIFEMWLEKEAEE